MGNAKTLERSDTIWKCLVLDAKARKCYFDANDDVCLAKSILHVKHELDQLDDLLRSDSVLLSGSRWKVYPSITRIIEEYLAVFFCFLVKFTRKIVNFITYALYHFHFCCQ